MVGVPATIEGLEKARSEIEADIAAYHGATFGFRALGCLRAFG
jgi:hypothetical protein